MQKKKGISLIVLVITIIVMIILAAAIILSLNNAGIIGNANKAVDDTNLATIKSEADLKYAEYLINKSVIGSSTLENWLNQEVKHDGYYIVVYNGETYVLKEGSLAYSIHKEDANIGDYVSYDAGTESVTVKSYTGTTEENNMTEKDVDITPTAGMKWRILGLEGDKVKLISEEVFNPEGNKFSLYGAYSYLKAEEILNNACKTFGNGEYADGARSITMEDINKLTGYDKTTYVGGIRHALGTSELDIRHGTKLSYDGTTVFPGTNQTLDIITYPDINGTSYLTKGAKEFTYSYYYYTPTNENETVYNLLFKNKDNTGFVSYHVADTAVNMNTYSSVLFGIAGVYGGSVGFTQVYAGGIDGRYYNSEISNNNALRPVVILESNVMTDKVVAEDSTVTWNLK